MRKVTLAVLVCTVVISLLGTGVVMAVPGGKDSPANDNPNNLYLYPKAPITWDIIWDGAWGKLNFRLSGALAALIANRAASFSH